MNFKNLLAELKRRNVIKSALAYLVSSWVIIQVMSTVLPTIDAPEYILKLILICLVLGFPLWIIFSWVYEITPEGIKKTKNIDSDKSITHQTSNRLNKIIIGALGVAIVLLLISMFNGNQTTTISLEDNNTITESSVMDKSIAVLAFADMSPNKDQEYFSDGISEEILNLLAKIPELKVISRTSSFSYKGKEQNIKKIGEELQVAHVLEGSIRKSGNTFRITTQLINVADGTHLWSETYDHDMEDIFKIQDEISAKVTQQLKVTILGDVVATKETNPEAYNLYLQAKQLSLQRTSESNENAEKLIRQSIAIDSTYAPAWALLGDVISKSAIVFIRRTITEGITLGKAAVLKAIALDDQDALAYSILADYNAAEWDFEALARNTNKALELASENAEIIRRAAGDELDLGKNEEAIVMIKKAIRLDPLNYIQYFNLALFYSWNEQYDEAEASIQKYLLMYPDAGFAHNFMGAILLARGDYEQALVEVEKDDDPFWGMYRKTMVVFAMGRTDEANTLLQQLIDEFGNSTWPNIAHVYAFRGETDAAFKWLELAYDNRDASLLEILNYPEFKSLYGDPRWNAFINKLGLPKDHGFHMD